MPIAGKQRWTVTRQFLVGSTTEDLRRMLRDNTGAIDRCYWHRFAFLRLMSVINSRYQRDEERDFGAAVAATRVEHAPIFILGHWRSGTTHLHNLLVRTSGRFAFPTVYQASFPHTFLSTEATIPRGVERYVPKTRLFDNVAFHLSLPQEDEFALCIASGISSLLGMVFPRRAAHYDRYLTLRDVPPADVARWKSTLLWFLKKLTYRYGKPLALKSPPHTARVRLLLELFPHARFVHIARHPYAVFQSTRHMYDTMVWNTYLQRPRVERIADGILQRYGTMYDAYFADRAAIPPGRLHELRFEDLRRDPVGEMRALYRALALEAFDEAESNIRRYVDSLRGYQQNDYAALAPADRERVTHAWRRNFERWGYAA